MGRHLAGLIAAIVLLAAYGAKADWYLLQGGCESASQIAEATGVPAIADPYTLRNYTKFHGIYSYVTVSRSKFPDAEMIAVHSMGPGIYGPNINNVEYFVNQDFCRLVAKQLAH